MIKGTGIDVEIAGRVLVRSGNFLVGPEEKVGLVGRNGAGKSSLISVIVGTAGPHVRSHGQIETKGTVGFLPQVPVPEGLGLEPTGFSHVLSARGLDVLDDQLHLARQAMAADPNDGNIARFSDLEERYGLAGGYEVEGAVGRLADGLGLREDLLLEDITSLSGGQRRRVDLIRVLFQDPTTMVLDEPTNHLDLQAKRWLLDELARRPGALLIISHDLPLLDQAITKVINLADHELHEYKGNYSAFRIALTGDIEKRETLHGREDKEIRRLSSLADSMRGSTETRARKAKVLDRKVQRMSGQRTELIKREKKVVFRLPTPPRSGAIPLVVQDLAVRYGGRGVLERVTFSVDRGDRYVIIGRNGAGKSSLLRCLSGYQEPSAGKVELGYEVHLGYFAQEHEQLDPERIAVDHLDDRVVPRDADRRALLGSFGLAGTTADQLPTSLSGGERAKLSLAVLAAGHANVLVLDEPTNNLDPASVEAVGTMLSRWAGTVIAVSHDRPFVEALRPTHALHLPEERADLWRDRFLDDVELR